MKDKIKNIILLVSSVVIFLIIFELALHLPLNINREYFDFWMFPDRIFYLDGEGNRVYFDDVKEVDLGKIDIKTIHHHLNSSYYCGKNKEYKRIVFLVDSVTMGDDVENNKMIFTSILEEKLNKDETNKIEVINYAISGYNLLDQNILLKTDALKCKPDLIIYPYYQNDLYWVTYFSPFFIPYLKSRYSKNLIHNFRTYYFFADKLTKLRFNTLKNRLSYKNAKTILDEMLNISKENNITFYIINFPDIKDGYPSDNSIEKYGKERGIYYLDIRKNFLEKNIDPLTLRASPDDYAHYNYYGHRTIADILYKDLLEKSLILK